MAETEGGAHTGGEPMSETEGPEPVRGEQGARPGPEVRGGKPAMGKARKAAAGLGAAALGAYAVYLLGARRARRRPVTELPNALAMPLEYEPWGDVFYAYYQREGAGRPVVFLHSINAAASAHEMRPIVRAFTRGTERPLFALEWVGFGHSDRPEIAYEPALMEDQLEHFLERVVKPAGGADVIALSLGAAYAAEVARRRPDLIRSLVALEPAGLGKTPGGIPRIWSRLLFTLPGVQRAFYDRLTTPESLHQFAAENLFTPEFGVPDDFVDFGSETSRMEGASFPLDDFLSGRMFPRDTADTFRRLRQPVLVIHGTVENRRQENYDQLPELEGRPNVTVVGLPTGGLPHWERAAEVWERVRDFLEAPAAQP